MVEELKTEWTFDDRSLLEQLLSNGTLDKLFDTLKFNYGESILRTEPQESKAREHIYNKAALLDDLRIEVRNQSNIFIDLEGNE